MHDPLVNKRIAREGFALVSLRDARYPSKPLTKRSSLLIETCIETGTAHLARNDDLLYQERSLAPESRQQRSS
jgi:hypothetical protein